MRELEASTSECSRENVQGFFTVKFKFLYVDALLLSLQREWGKRASDCSICSIAFHDI
jgi:hypothetical protein